MTTPQETAVIEAIKVKHRAREAALKAVFRIDNQCDGRIRSHLGWTPDLPEAEAAKIKKVAQQIRAHIQRGKKRPRGYDGVIDLVTGFVVASAEARGPFSFYARAEERIMRKMARELGVFTWVRSVRGFGELNLARIIGEAGDLADYATVSKLWKRLGLAVINGRRQGDPGPEPTKQDWIDHGYSGRRRSNAWNLGECLVKQNNDGYKAMYDSRKAYEMDRGIVRGHADRRAKRYMTKAAIRDLWAAARACQRSQDDDPAD